jgi:hypothetical protein
MAKSKGLPPGTLKKILHNELKNINKSFWKQLQAINLPEIIRKIIRKGIIPIAGFGGRFQQYSESYKLQIQGKLAFFKNKGGKAVGVSALSDDELDSFRASNKARWTNEGNKEFIAERAKKFKGKRVSPVNMHLTGKMLGSLYFEETTGKLIATDEKWQYHNGEAHERAPNMPERRLLPTRDGERFNRRIEQNLTEALAKALKQKSGKLKKFMKVNIRL